LINIMMKSISKSIIFIGCLVVQTFCFAANLQALQQLEMFNASLSGVTPNKAPSGPGPIAPKAAKPKNAKSGNSKTSKDESSTDSAAEAAAQVESDDAAINREAFEVVRKKMFPLKSEQVLKLHQEYNASEFALASSAGTPPRPAVTTQTVKLDPGSTPSVIRLGQGFISTVVFLDSTGAPWPIVAYDLGDPSSFNIQWDKSGNILMIQSRKLYTYGNMAIRLQGLNTPIMLTLVPGQQAIDYRVDMRVLGYGPNAKNLPSTVNLPAAGSNVLMQVLDDVPPPGSRQMKVKGGPAKAWTVGHTMYVRTRLTVLSPGWVSMMTSADGMHVYEMPDSPILLVSWHGKVMQLKIEGL
jgi:intracellular multiplication protein IcmK